MNSVMYARSRCAAFHSASWVSSAHSSTVRSRGPFKSSFLCSSTLACLSATLACARASLASRSTRMYASSDTWLGLGLGSGGVGGGSGGVGVEGVRVRAGAARLG